MLEVGQDTPEVSQVKNSRMDVCRMTTIQMKAQRGDRAGAVFNTFYMLHILQPKKVGPWPPALGERLRPGHVHLGRLISASLAVKTHGENMVPFGS